MKKLKISFQFISLFIILLLIFLRFYSTRPVFKNGDTVRITTKVLTEPIVYTKSQYLKLNGLKVYLPKYPEITYGDNIVIQGAVNDDKLENPKLISVNNTDKGFLYKFRNNLIIFYKKSLPEPYASLTAGTVIGSKNMPEQFWDKLKATGTAHIVVASGTNVTMTAGFLLSISTYFLKRKKAIWIVIAGILTYVIISGFDAPIIRAGIMGGILFISQEKGRLVSGWRVLIYTCLVMLLIKPIWITDLGFILSFVATLSLMLFQKKINNLLKFVPS
ncbi:MAG: ComEC/Rec2 family competence protein, partial [Candidatus Woesebacteria bacterium]|nr:ComEC/Rec2 family competence protein [Candidatus Woesebacteria bacterium]